MPHINPALPNDGDNATASSVDSPFTTIINLLNGGLDFDNLADNGVTNSKLAAGAVTVDKLAASALTGWIPLSQAPNTVAALGNRTYTVTFNAIDFTSILSPGMRMRLTRSVAAPTQCASLNGTTNWFSKTSPAGMTFTNNFVVSAWIKVASYSNATIASRYNGTSGWDFVLYSDGRVALRGFNAGAANTSYVQSGQSVPLNRWVHVAAQLDMATFTASPTTSYIMMDGVDIPANVARGGTNPTALVQAGNLEIGSENSGAQLFPGKLAQIAIYSAKVTQSIILASISQTLAGTETSLISAYTLNNSLLDLNANANNLTANGAATTTNADSPYALAATAGLLEYGIITAATFSTNTAVTVQVPEGSPLPTSGGVSAVSYAITALPYLFPAISKFKLAAWDTSGALTNSLLSVMTQYILNNPLENLLYTNPSNGGGTYYLSVNGIKKTVRGATTAQTIGGAAPATALLVVTFPTSFFTTVQTAIASSGPPGTNSQYSFISVPVFSASSISLDFNQVVGTAVIFNAQFEVAGT